MAALHPSTNPNDFKEIAGFPGHFMGRDRSPWRVDDSGKWRKLKVGGHEGRETFSVLDGSKYKGRYVHRVYAALFENPFDPAVEYRAVPDYPGYRVGDDGSVWSCMNVAFGMSDCWHQIKPRTNRHKEQYLVTLFNGYGNWTVKVSRLILMVFVGPCPPGMEACHFPDPNPANNRLENIRWDTHEANENDKKSHGTSPIGENNPGAILSEAQVREVRRLRKQRLSAKKISIKLGVSESAIKQIVYGYNWSHVI